MIGVAQTGESDIANGRYGAWAAARRGRSEWLKSGPTAVIVHASGFSQREGLRTTAVANRSAPAARHRAGLPFMADARRARGTPSSAARLPRGSRGQQTSPAEDEARSRS